MGQNDRERQRSAMVWNGAPTRRKGRESDIVWEYQREGKIERDRVSLYTVPTRWKDRER